MRKPAADRAVHSRMRSLVTTLVFLVALPAAAGDFPLPPARSDVIGETLTTAAEAEDTLLDLARRYGLGYEEITNANPGIDPWLPGAGTVVVVPKRRLLPRAPRTGIVINLPEHRLYWYPPVAAGQPPVVWTFPVSIGKMDWNTPLGRTTIVSKAKDAPWIPPKSVREEHAKRGRDLFRRSCPGAPTTRWGVYKMALGIPGRRLPDPRHQPAGGHRHAGDARLHAALSGGHRNALRHGADRHAGHDREPALQVGLARRRAADRGASAAAGGCGHAADA